MALLACLVRLGSSTYWQDEGLTAFLGRTVRETGLPMAWDGRNLAHDRYYQRTHNEDLVWVGHPWLPYYIVAAAQAVGGVSPWAGRLPFALSGWLALVLLYPAGVRVLGSSRAAFWGFVAGASSVPFYLYTRQCQYYPLLVLGSVLVWWALVSLPERPRAGYALTGGLLLLVFSQPVSVLGVLPACLWVTARNFRPWRACVRYLIAGGTAVLLFLLFQLYAESWQMYGAYASRGLPWRVRAPLQVWRYLWEVNLWAFPLAAAPLVVWATRAPPPGAAAGAVAEPAGIARLAVATLLGLLALGVVAPFPFFRYVLPLLPPCWWLLGSGIARALQARRWFGAFVACTLLATQMWSALGHRVAARALDWAAPGGLLRAGLARLEPFAHRWRTHHLEFAYELTHTYTGPVDGLLAFFRDAARPGQTLAITYPQEPLALLTDLRLVSRIPATYPAAARLPGYLSSFGIPDWVVVRQSYPNVLFDAEAFFAKHGALYIRHELPVPDVTWNNRPYPPMHRFRTPTEGPPLVVYERVPPPPSSPAEAEASGPGTGP